MSSQTTGSFTYKVKSDNSPTEFGIDFEGCVAGATITMNYYYKGTLYSKTYACADADTQKIAITDPTSKSFAYSDATKIVTFTRTTLPGDLPNKI